MKEMSEILFALISRIIKLAVFVRDLLRVEMLFCAR